MRYLFTIIVVIISNFAYSQTDTTFNNIYSPHQGTTVINSLINHANSNYYYALFGQIDTPDYKQNYGFLKISKNGNIVDTAFYEVGDKLIGTDVNMGHAFIRTSDSSFLYCGGAKDTSGRVLGFLVKTNSDLDTLWTKLFQHPDTLLSIQNNTSVFQFRDIKETPDGGYILVGEYNYHCTGNARRGFLIKTDTAGNVIWVKLLSESIRDIEIDPIDSGFFYPGANGAIVGLYKANKFGDQIWFKRTNFEQYPFHPMDAEIIDSTHVAVASVYSHSNIYNTKSVVVAMVNTINRDTVWIKKYSFFNLARNLGLFQSISINKVNDNIVVSSTAGIDGDYFVPPSYIEGGFRAVLLKINQNGDSLWQRFYSHLNTDGIDEDIQLNDLAVCNDGGFLLGGFYHIHSYIYTDCWLVKTDSLGFAPAAFTVGIESEELIITNYELRIYPNPTSDNINLSMQESPKEELQLELYNISGQLVLEKRLPAFDKEHRINIQHLQLGIYLVKLVSENQVVYSSKIIKE